MRPIAEPIADSTRVARYELASDGNTWLKAYDVRWAQPVPEPLELWVSAFCGECGCLCEVDASVFDIATRALCGRCMRMSGRKIAGIA